MNRHLLAEAWVCENLPREGKQCRVLLKQRSVKIGITSTSCGFLVRVTAAAADDREKARLPGAEW